MGSTARGSTASSDEIWQRRLLPLMVQMVVALALFFFVVSLVQLTYLHRSIRDAPQIDLAPAFTTIDAVEPTTYVERLDAAQLKALALMERGTVERRYHQTNTLLMTRVWTRYMGFVTGMILSMLGAIFVLGKLQDTSGDRARTSPGIILAALGVVLMVVTIFVHQPIEGTDAPSALRSLRGGAVVDSLALPDTAPDVAPR